MAPPRQPRGPVGTAAALALALLLLAAGSAALWRGCRNARQSLPDLAAHNLWAMHASGQIVRCPAGAEALLAILDDARRRGDPLVRLTLTAHSDERAMFLTPDYSQYIEVGQTRLGDGSLRREIRLWNGRDLLDITSQLSDAMHGDGVVQLQGCRTALGDDNLARRMSHALPGRTIEGTLDDARQIAPNTAVGNWRAYRDGEVVK